jgi:hypothetical protein
MQFVAMPSIAGRIIDDLENSLGFHNIQSDFGDSVIYTRWRNTTLRWTRANEVFDEEREYADGYEDAYWLSYGRFGGEVGSAMWALYVELSLDPEIVHSGKVSESIRLKTEFTIRPTWSSIFTLQFATADIADWQRHANTTVLNLLVYGDMISNEGDLILSDAETVVDE